ncbi:MAG: hypothetical protein IPN17_23885 [Deltaproteobacteria bacterium]|nr:hypothetical protein [Deltaproteobacteria bacterium]
MGARVDILEQHVEEATFLYRRLRRSCRLLDGNARQTRSLLARIDAHVDALTLFSRETVGMLPPPEKATDPGERFVATALASATGDGLAALGGADFGRDGHVAVRDAMLRYATSASRTAVEGWLAEGGDAARGVGVELLARWRDPRAAQVASRAVRRGSGVLRAAGACALGRLGEAVAEETVVEVMGACAKETAWSEDVLDATVHAAPTTALAVARRWEGGRLDLAWVLLGLRGAGEDRERLREALGAHGAAGALPAALALAGEHRTLDGLWAGAEALRVSNALREAAYVVLGGEAPPVVVRDDMVEEPEDRAQRAQEDAALRERMAGVGPGAWRWGAGATPEAMTAVAGTLGPRPRRWCQAGLALWGQRAAAVWDDVAVGGRD